jgi:Tfp pilus assembly protein PilO
MTKRDRLAGLVIGGVAILAAFWFLLLGPKRAEVQSLKDKTTQAQARLQTANQTAATAGAARGRYDADYATVARLGKAVPADDDVASLVYQLDAAAHGSKIDFRSIKLDNRSAPAAPAPGWSCPSATAPRHAWDRAAGTRRPRGSRRPR